MTLCSHMGPVTGLVTIAGPRIGPFSPLTGRGIASRLFLPPRIAATLVRGWSLPLRWRAAPLLCPRFFAGLARLFLSLSGSFVQRDAVGASLF